MKKSIIIGALSVAMATMLVGCGSDEEKYAKLADLGGFP